MQMDLEVIRGDSPVAQVRADTISRARAMPAVNPPMRQFFPCQAARFVALCPTPVAWEIP